MSDTIKFFVIVKNRFLGYRKNPFKVYFQEMQNCNFFKFNLLKKKDLPKTTTKDVRKKILCSIITKIKTYLSN